MKPRCERCGEELPCIDVTAFGDPEPVYIAAADCPCPAERCPFCHSKTYLHQCWNIDCFLVGNIVPIPEWA